MVNFTPPPAQHQPNPLQKYFRQPKVYINLPSKGKYYPVGSIDMPVTGELPVFPMTAKDELTIKTPDALLNGQATVDVIKSCVPNIKDPWKMPSIDLDTILIAIRIATYGENLEITTKTPNTGEEKDYQIDLRKILNKLTTVDYEDIIVYDNFTVVLRPLTYEEFTKSSLKTFEEQRIFRLVNDDKISDEEKLSKFAESFDRLTTLTIDTMIKCVSKIIVDDIEVTNPAHIQEFIQNSEKTYYKKILEHLESQKEKFKIEPLKVVTTEEEQSKGAPKEFSIPITFDQSNFFV